MKAHTKKIRFRLERKMNLIRIARNIAIAVFLGLFLLDFQSCQKYDEGPWLSLRSRTERVSNTWKVDNYKINGNDYTSLLSGYTETYTEDGDFSFQWGSLSGTGNWSFQNRDEEIKLNGINNVPSKTLFILKLEEKQFWYYYMDGNDKKELHLIEN